jgi:hypothetical protein
MDKRTVVEELKEALRTNNHLRHRIGLEEGEGPEVLKENGEPGDVIAWTDAEGQDWFLQVQEA